MSSPSSASPQSDATPPRSMIRIVADPAAIFQAASEEWRQRAHAAIADHGRFTVALAGGSTPKGLYSLLAGAMSNQLPWDKTYFFFGDERHVPPDQLDSNYRMATETLLSRVPVPAKNIFRIHAEEADAAVAALQYEVALRTFFLANAADSDDQFPRFDLVLLGMGPDGHTASLFPGTRGLAEPQRWVIANWVEKFNTWRITLTYPVLNAAHCILFMVAGADKAAMLHTILETPSDTDAPMEQFPSRYVRPRNGELIWLLDRAAAGPSAFSTPPASEVCA